LEELDSFTKEIVESYEVFSSSLMGMFYFATRNQNMASELRVFSKSSDSLLNGTTNFMWTRVRQMSDKTFGDALVRSGALVARDANVDILVSSAVENTVTAVARQMLKDIEGMTLDIKRLIVSAELQNRLSGQTELSSFIGAKNSVKLTYVDRSGRRWRSDRYIRSVIRSHLIGINADAYAISAASLKKTSIILSNGVVIPLENYQELRAMHLHPNTKVFPKSIK